jgi:hypothetical protein
MVFDCGLVNEEKKCSLLIPFYIKIFFLNEILAVHKNLMKKLSFKVGSSL